MKKYTDEFLLSELRRFYDENGRSPKKKEFITANGYPSAHVYQRKYGSWNNALELINLQKNELRNVDRTFLINELYRFFDLHKKVPTMEDFKNSEFPSPTTYQRYFKSWNIALSYAKFKLNTGVRYSDEWLLDEIKRYVSDNGVIPEYRNLLPEFGYPSAKTYVDRFGSFNNALIKCGFKPNKIIHEYNGTETCSICGSSHTYKTWNYDSNDNRMCDRCKTKIWFKQNPNKLKMYKYKQDSKHRGYKILPINNQFKSSDGHHLWLESDDFVVFIPSFIHKLYWHSHHKPETMLTINAVSIDYWVNEDFYNELYLTGDVSGT